MYSIYTLIDPRTGDIRYVGFTKNVEQRYYYHCLTIDSLSSACRWLKELKYLGIKPYVRIMEDSIDSKAQAWERESHWMNKLLDVGEPLVNYVAPCRRKMAS